MASSNVIILSSSSPTSWIATTPPGKSNAAMSSSPNLPSPSQLMNKGRPSILTGSRAIALPAGTPSSFMRASSLLGKGIVREGTVSAHFKSNPQPVGNTLLSSIVLDSDIAMRGPEVAVVPLVKKRSLTSKKATAADKQALKPIAKEAAESYEGIVDKPVVKKTRVARKRPSATTEKSTAVAVSEKVVKVGKTTDAVLVKKPRATKKEAEEQTKLRKGKIIKPATGGTVIESGKVAKAPGKRKSLVEDTPEIFPAHVEIHVNERDESLGLDMAIARRQSWTPVKDRYDTAVDNQAVLETTELTNDLHDSGIDLLQASNLGTHLSNYSYQHIPEMLAATGLREGSGISATKRRKIELIDTSNCRPSKTKPVKRSRSPKKKPQTITDKATAPFLPEVPVNASPLLQYLTPPVLAYDNNAESADPLRKDPPRETGVQKAIPRSKKPKTPKLKSAKPTSTLLLPEQAMKATIDQNLMFGTSSQLVCDDSPTFVLDFQKVMKESESFTAISDIGTPNVENETPLAEFSVSRRVSSRNLWSVAARDSQGSLFEAEIVDLVDTPLPRYRAMDKIVPLLEPSNDPKIAPTETGFTTIDDFTSPQLEPPIILSAASSVTTKDAAVPHDGTNSLPRCVAETALRPRTKARSPTKKQKPSEKQDFANIQMPRYTGYTLDQLSKDIKKYGFKPIKSREAMINLLERCWESKNRLALQSLPPNVNVPSLDPHGEKVAMAASETTSPTKRKGRPPKANEAPGSIDDKTTPAPKTVKPRGRPKKDKVSSVATNETQMAIDPAVTPPKSKKQSKAKRNQPDEIEDPDPPTTPSPPRRHSQLPPKPLPLAKPSANVPCPSDSLVASPDLFNKITEAVISYPPRNDPENLTWHEKILIYDPIVIEDLAAWLNTEGLGRVGVDDGVGPETVKDWCEERSICCLWRDGWRGKRGKA